MKVILRIVQLILVVLLILLISIGYLTKGADTVLVFLSISTIIILLLVVGDILSDYY